ncbi:MAG: ligase-associated DNA damage response endonuclease PdeM [Bacteroidia bacterium]|nr:ligase-associated DNA damage response endonuclease PdeM [Bacteroidia bacterium]
MISVSVKNEELILCKQKAIWWPRKRMLIISDLHVGKVSHFRLHGIAAPVELIKYQFDELIELFNLFNPSSCIIVGDLFHAKINKEWDKWVELLQQYHSISFTLIRGNHDTIPAYVFKHANMKTSMSFIQEPFLFVHQPEVHHSLYVISGHIHPGIKLNGKGKQHLTLPCFYFGESYALLPAFGNFTGLQLVEPNKHDKVYVITKQEVIAIN